MTIHISPSLAAGNLLRLEEELRRLESSGADSIHFDVMDGHFVPLLTIGVPLLEQIRQSTTMHLDVHIMVSNPDHVFEDYLEAGADTLTFHIEAATHAHRICTKIREKGKRAGIAINPATHWCAIEYLLPTLDQVTIMTVNPGFSRQKHLPEMHEKIRELASCAKATHPNVVIQIDGGVSASNVKTLYNCGATSFVAGGAIMGQPDYRIAVSQIRDALKK